MAKKEIDFNFSKRKSSFANVLFPYYLKNNIYQVDIRYILLCDTEKRKLLTFLVI